MASEEIFQSKAEKTNQQEQKTSVCHREVRSVFPQPWEAADPCTLLWFGSTAQRGERLWPELCTQLLDEQQENPFRKEI